MRLLRPRPPLWMAALLLLSAFAWGDEPWEEAVRLFAANRDLVPGRLTIEIEQYNGQGGLLSSETSEIRIFVESDGELGSEVVRATRDGNDVTESRRDDSSGKSPFTGNGEPGDSPFAGFQRSPFDPLEQESVTVTATGTIRYVDGRFTTAHRFTHATGAKSSTVGTAYLAGDGTPLLLEATIEPLPPFVESLFMTQRFVRDGQGRWYTSEITFTGSGTFLFFRRSVESVFRLNEYFARQQ